MSKHFHDSRYYLQRAVHHAVLGVREHLDPHLERVRTRLGSEPEPEPEPSRLETVREDVVALERGVERRARETVAEARARVDARRPDGR
ncbi:DUF7553 family protein [Halopiger goleimassiliensis]|uniref:DUF7553 family protein n=1 Tax=Halopiger goleimassiliensis TaxID=1293048 RepID=UPI0006781B8D|nr:hypothetical protein [Halopiger goleimassiliensis]